MEYLHIIAGVVFVVLSSHVDAGGFLSFDFYKESCPQLDSIVREGVHTASLMDPSTPAALLRLMFHDCQVQGCDASILIDPDGVRAKDSEMKSLKNFGIGKRDVINLIKSKVEAACPRQVSCADILVMAAREAVDLSGGPRISIALGRRDSSSPPNSKLVDASLPSADIGLDGVLQLFGEKGMSVEESVAILGAHTLGVTHCYNLQNRLYKYPGSAINPGFVNLLKLSCSLRPPGSQNSYVKNDFTPVTFDNNYFVKSLHCGGVLQIDAEMPLDLRTKPFVIKFAADQGAFFQAFSTAFVKLSSSHVLMGNEGVVRTACNAL